MRLLPIAEKDGVPCPSHGFADKLGKAARDLVVALEQKSGINIATKKIDAVFEEMKNARHKWRGR